uniref:Uncharacterized protein n=1 Tax=Parascaris equorum TaxID=6256 RepID=A0A914RFY7_PAREQ
LIVQCFEYPFTKLPPEIFRETLRSVLDSRGGTQLFLVFYTILMVAGLMLGMASAFVWTGIPIIIISMSIYALAKEKHKYLYPFLIISVCFDSIC